MDTVMLNWLREGAVVRMPAVTAGGTPVRFLDYDPERYLIVLPSLPAAVIFYSVGDSRSIFPIVTLPAGTAPSVITEDYHGELVRMPWYAWVGSGNPGFMPVALSYGADKQRVRDEYIRRYLSNIGTL